MEHKKIKLHLGCGQKYLEGYENIDYPASEHTVMKVKADRYADLRDLHYEENSVDEIRNHHVFEHFSRAEALTMLLRWRRWLKPGGVIHIETPDFERCVQKFLINRRRTKLQLGRHIFGSQEARWADHLDFWYAQKFNFVLKELGFSNIKIKKYNNSIAQRAPGPLRFVPRFMLNIAGDLVPNSFYEKYGGHKLPNIEIFAVKTGENLNEKEAVRKILKEYLVGREGDEMLSVWMKEAGF